MPSAKTRSGKKASRSVSKPSKTTKPERGTKRRVPEKVAAPTRRKSAVVVATSKLAKKVALKVSKAAVKKAQTKTSSKAVKPAKKQPENKKKKVDDTPADSGKKSAAEGDKKIVTGIKKGKAMVDAKVPNGSKFHVFEQGGKVYAASLMWSDLRNNNNKYYIIQLLQEDANKDSFMVWNRWGRVGSDGQFAQFRFGNAFNAETTYQKKYSDKVGKGYTEIEISYDEEDKATKGKKGGKKAKDGDKADSGSKLDSRTQDLVKLIFNMDMMKQQMVEIGYDAKKMPLGKLSKDTIKKGYEVLKRISDVLDGKKKGDLFELSSQFFTVIPHDFGFKYSSLCFATPYLGRCPSSSSTPATSLRISWTWCSR